MALDKSKLTSGVLAAFNGGLAGDDTETVSKNLAKAYDDYCQDAEDFTSDVPLMVNKGGMEKILIGSSSDPLKTLVVNVSYTGSHALDGSNLNVWLLDNNDLTVATKLESSATYRTEDSLRFENLTEVSVYILAFVSLAKVDTVSVGDILSVSNYKNVEPDMLSSTSTGSITSTGIEFGDIYVADSGATAIGTVPASTDDDLPEVPHYGLSWSQSAACAAAIIANAVSKYWKGAQFDVMNPPPGAVSEINATVILPPVIATLKSELKAIFDNNAAGATTPDKAQQIADKMDISTKTTMVLCAGLTALGVPISVSGTVK